MAILEKGLLRKVPSGGGGSSNSFETINVPNGTNPVADSATDTLNFTSVDDSVTITGTSGTDTVDFKANQNIDGGAAASVYLVSQNIDGGNA